MGKSVALAREPGSGPVFGVKAERPARVAQVA
jgi:hypothetical protein